MPSRCPPPFLLSFIFALGAFSPALAQAPAAAEPRPTVTPENGDTGGTFFGQKPDPQQSRHYFIAAEDTLWDFAPLGREEMCGGPLPPQLTRNRKAGKIRYVQYTDATFTSRVIADPAVGIMGPVLRGVVGDFLVVTFLNRSSQPLSLHPHGVKYDKHSEGAYYLPAPGRGAAVAPKAVFTYVWHLDEASGPLPDEPSSKAWLYHSHVAGDEEINLGLMGAIIVTDPKRARPDGTPRDIDREFASLFLIFDESDIGEAAREAAEYGLPPPTGAAAMSWSEMQQSLEQGARYAINGYVFGNHPIFQMNEGERTRWYLFALGSELDLHTAHWHGLRVLENGRRRTDVIELLPASMKVADALADNPGTWLFHCHVAEHMREGMFARVVIHPRDAVGVDRSPEASFLGHPSRAQSLRLHRAAARPDGTIELAGSVTVFGGFAVFNEPLIFRLGERTLAFQPNTAGRASLPGATLRVTNANEFGVINTGLLEFELTLQPSPETRAALSAGSLSLTAEIARGHHAATANLR